jgi:hypothetical protein
MSLRDTSSRAALNYTTHVHSAFNREAATQQTALATLAAILALDLSGGGGNIDISTLAKENTLVSVKNALEGTLDVNVVDISGLALESTQADLLTLAERQDIDGVLINQGHPSLTSYDFTNNHVLMTMLGPTMQDFRWNIDTKFNRDGWTFSTGNGEVLGSNCYWYANGAGTGNQTDLLYEDFTSWYTIATIDNTGDVEAAPFIAAYSPPTGTSDIIPTFAHSRWVFALPGDTKLFQNEKVLLYYGEIPKVHPELRHLSLNLVGSGGDRAPTEKVYLITTNTASGLAVGAVNYVLQGAGFVAKDIGREYYFSNSLSRKQLANLSATNIPVQVSNFPTTQAVSISGTVNVSGGFYQATQPVSIAETVDVSGAFYQATQPVSIAEVVDVSGAFYQATQPVSIADTVAVSGTFYQATQPVSIAEVVDVSGAFYQATQPVSIADTVAVSGTFYQATQPVSIAAVVDVSGAVTVLNFPAVQDVSNGILSAMTFTVDKGINYLNTNVIGIPLNTTNVETVSTSLFDNVGNLISPSFPLSVKVIGTPPTTYAWTLDDFTPTDGSIGSFSPTIDARLFNSLTAFGISTHSGGGGNPDLTYQYSLDDITFYDTPFEITLPTATVFSNTQSLGAPYVRFIVRSHALDTLTLNVAVR